MQQHELEAWLGPALAEMTPGQVSALVKTIADAIEARYDDEALRCVAASGALQIVLSQGTLEQLGEALARARQEEREAMAMLTGAIIASAETDSESSLARRAGVTRVTVRRALGK
jgi:malonyl CoA-acyl carrier protein transacylase